MTHIFCPLKTTFSHAILKPFPCSPLYTPSVSQWKFIENRSCLTPRHSKAPSPAGKFSPVRGRNAHSSVHPYQTAFLTPIEIAGPAVQSRFGPAISIIRIKENLQGVSQRAVSFGIAPFGLSNGSRRRSHIPGSHPGSAGAADIRHHHIPYMHRSSNLHRIQQLHGLHD
jgi:hypothetical protein